ncbi:hypothetical protein [Kaistia sp. MMO-174]|uniref:hypothetical protein n=1 Tax=Kaistia sp. MMO-174 TaxID=3081256 RepID=UPI003018F6C6
MKPSERVALISIAFACVLTGLFWYFVQGAAWWLYAIIFVMSFGSLHRRLLSEAAAKKTIDG